MEIEEMKYTKFDKVMSEAFRNQIPINFIIGLDTFSFLVTDMQSDMHIEYNHYELIEVN